MNHLSLVDIESPVVGDATVVEGASTEEDGTGFSSWAIW